MQACGAKYSIKGEFLDEVDVDDVVVALVDLARAVSYNIIEFCFFFPFIYFYYSILHTCINISDPLFVLST